jgi:hypothetical protein
MMATAAVDVHAWVSRRDDVTCDPSQKALTPFTACPDLKMTSGVDRGTPAKITIPHCSKAIADK